MTCNHTAGVKVHSELVYDLDDVSGLDAHQYILDVKSVICQGCGARFTFGGMPGLALNIVPVPGEPARAIGDLAAVTAEDFELLS